MDKIIHTKIMSNNGQSMDERFDFIETLVDYVKGVAEDTAKAVEVKSDINEVMSINSHVSNRFDLIEETFERKENMADDVVSNLAEQLALLKEYKALGSPRKIEEWLNNYERAVRDANAKTKEMEEKIKCLELQQTTMVDYKDIESIVMSVFKHYDISDQNQTGVGKLCESDALIFKAGMELLRLCRKKIGGVKS